MSSYASVIRPDFQVVEYPEDLRRRVASTAEIWQAFCALPPQVKLGVAPYDKKAGSGYELKDGSGRNGDRKENFDFKSNFRGVRASDPQEAAALITSVAQLLEEVQPLVLHCGRVLETSFGIPGLVEELQCGDSTFFIRLLHYPGERLDGEELAVPHIDKGVFTPHLFQTAPGLQILDQNTRQWIDTPIDEQCTVVFPGAQMQYRTDGNMKAACHRVMATTDTAVSGRYSAVCFVDLGRTPAYDKDKHGRMQEFPVGFNYDMPWDEFRGLFKPR
jgi:isopenicillin N synthase-like dioxygenase